MALTSETGGVVTDGIEAGAEELLPAVLPQAMPLAVAVPLDQNPAAVYLASLGSEKSRRAMAGALRVLVSELGGEAPESFPWHALGYQHAQALRSRLSAKYAPATANKILSALRGVLREAMRLGQMSAEDCTRACDVKAVKGSRLPAGRSLSRGEVRAVLADAGEGAQGSRDAALFAVLYGCGLRRAEVVGLDLAHVDLGAGSLRVLGKGNKERAVFCPPGTMRALKAWLGVRGDAPGPLFRRVNKAGAIEAHRLGESSVSFILDRMAERADVDGFSPHDLRRTFVGDMLDAGADIATVQGMAGHASVTTTQRYDRRGERAKQRAAALLDVPSAW